MSLLNLESAPDHIHLASLSSAWDPTAKFDTLDAECSRVARCELVELFWHAHLLIDRVVETIAEAVPVHVLKDGLISWRASDRELTS